MQRNMIHNERGRGESSYKTNNTKRKEGQSSFMVKPQSSASRGGEIRTNQNRNEGRFGSSLAHRRGFGLSDSSEIGKDILQDIIKPEVNNRIAEKYNTTAITNHISFGILGGGMPIIRQTVIIDRLPHEKIILLILTILTYYLLTSLISFIWNKYHPKSRKLFIFIIILFLPLLVSNIKLHPILIASWLIYLLIIGLFILRLTTERLATPKVPKETFLIISTIFIVTMVLGMVGNLTAILGFFMKKYLITYSAFKVIVFSLYFGLLTQKICEKIGFWIFKENKFFKPYILNRKGQSNSIGNDIGSYHNGSCINPEEKETCSICRMQLSKDLTLTLKCNHAFHSMCIKGVNFCGSRGKCPECNDIVDFIKLNNYFTYLKPYFNILESFQSLIVMLVVLATVTIYVD